MCLEEAYFHFLYWKSSQALEQAAQGHGGVPIPGDVQKACRCGTSRYGLEGMVVLGWRLDLMILEVFFQSMILCFYKNIISAPGTIHK